MKVCMLQVLLVAGALACAPTYAADVAAGKAKAELACADCHGDDGKGDDENPDIVKMSAAEFIKAMEEYQSGVRTKDAQMTKAAKKLSAADVANLAAYYETLK